MAYRNSLLNRLIIVHGGQILTITIIIISISLFINVFCFTFSRFSSLQHELKESLFLYYITITIVLLIAVQFISLFAYSYV